MRYLTLLTITLFLISCSDSSREDNFFLTCYFVDFDDIIEGSANLDNLHLNNPIAHYYDFDFGQNIVTQTDSADIEGTEIPPVKIPITKIHPAGIEFSNRIEEWSLDNTTSAYAEQTNYFLDRTTLQLFMEEQVQSFDETDLLGNISKEWVELIEPNNRLFQCTTPKV